MGSVVAGGMKEKKKGKYDEWELQDACRTLKRAEEIKADAGLMRALGPYLDKEIKTHKSIKELHSLANKKVKEEAEEASEK